MKYLVEIKDNYSSITLLTESHGEAIKLYNEFKGVKEVMISTLNSQDKADFINKINNEVYLFLPVFE